MRPRLAATSSTRTARPLSSPAPMRKAAEEGSPGTVMCRPSSPPSHPAGSKAASPAPARAGSNTTGAPIAASMRSVWSRESAGSLTETRTRARTPASSTADLTCALATLARWRSGLSWPVARARTRTGSRSGSPSYSIRVPMARRGYTIRRMGRLRSDGSPSRTAATPAPDRIPVSNRAVVPLFPQSSRGGAPPARPPPGQRIVRPPSSSSHSMAAPSRCMARTLERTSAPVESPRTTESEAASGARSAARCEIDLSPGTRTRIKASHLPNPRHRRAPPRTSRPAPARCAGRWPAPLREVGSGAPSTAH